VNAKDFEAAETVKNGVTFKVRAIQSADKAGMIEVFGRFEPELLYKRFFQSKRRVVSSAFGASLIPDEGRYPRFRPFVSTFEALTDPLTLSFQERQEIGVQSLRQVRFETPLAQQAWLRSFITGAGGWKRS